MCDYVKENGTYDGEDEEDEYDEHGHRCVHISSLFICYFHVNEAYL